MSATPQTETDRLYQISQLEKQLMADINDFNTKYSCYVHSSNNSAYPYINDIINNKLPACQNMNIRVNDLNAAKQTIVADINNLQSRINQYKNSNGITQSTYQAKFNQLIAKYDAILKQRKDLDTKLAELYGTDDGINNFYVNQYRATMFSKIMLTIVVTSLVYYTFMKIIKK